MIDYTDVEKVIENCFEEITAASRQKYDSDQADKTAALFLSAQIKLSLSIEEIEMKAKNAKNEIARIEGEKYFEYKKTSYNKNSGDNKKITENMLTNYVAKDDDIVKAKLECAQAESTLKKYNYLLGVLKDGHIFFRNLSKNKTWSE